MIERVDAFFQFGLPVVYLSGIVLLAAVLYLFLRRMFIPKVKYISLASDYFPLFLIMRNRLYRNHDALLHQGGHHRHQGADHGPGHLPPESIPEGIGGIFYVHLFFVSVLLAYFPFSKLMHLGGVFLSPTRNLTTNTRARRHVNPWNYPVKVHTYEAYEDEFREKMIEAGLPVDKQPEPQAPEEKE